MWNNIIKGNYKIMTKFDNDDDGFQKAYDWYLTKGSNKTGKSHHPTMWHGGTGSSSEDYVL